MNDEHTPDWRHRATGIRDAWQIPSNAIVDFLEAELRNAYREGLLRAAQICEGFESAAACQADIQREADKLN